MSLHPQNISLANGESLSPPFGGLGGLRYAIIGTGGIGGYYGGLLAKAGRDVHFLLHTDYEHVRDHGLQVNSCDGSYHLDHVNAYNDARLMPKCDVVLVCLKTTANHLLPLILPHVMHDKTIVVLIQNGIGVEADLQQQLPEAQLACGIAYICTTKMGPGLIEHTSNGRLTLGNFSCHKKASPQPSPVERELKISPPQGELEGALDAVVRDMANAGVKVQAADYLETRWKKCVWNMPFNGMTTLMNTDSASLLHNPATHALVYDLMMEVVGAAQACGAKTVTKDYADKMIDMTLHMPAYSSSMQVDHEHHRPMEIHYLYTRSIKEARLHGFDMPRMKMLEAMLKYL